jgi:hypothetical protein
VSGIHSDILNAISVNCPAHLSEFHCNRKLPKIRSGFRATFDRVGFVRLREEGDQMPSQKLVKRVGRAIVIVTGSAASTEAALVTFTGAGLSPSDATLVASRDLFRADLGGGTTPGANGSFGGVRREINWDGVPAASAAPNLLPPNFFNATSPRGVIFSAPGTGFQVSGAAADVGAGQPAAINFGNINPTYTTTFQQFSAQRLFTALGTNVVDVNFVLPGTSVSATVRGFGAIFSDVDTVGSTSLQLIDQNNVSLGTFNAPALGGGLSFVGVSSNAGERIGRVRITSGNAALGAGVNDGGATDLVVMDDFLYSEPVPEPASVAMVGMVGVGLLARRRRRA